MPFSPETEPVLEQQKSSTPQTPDKPRRVESGKRAFLAAIEKSEVAADLKDILTQYLEQRLHGGQREAFVSRVMEGGMSISELLEVVTEQHVTENPDFLRQIQAREISPAQQTELALDKVFTAALADQTTIDNDARIQRVLRAVKAIAADANN